MKKTFFQLHIGVFFSALPLVIFWGIGLYVIILSFTDPEMKEFDKIFSHLIHGSGQYRFVGVSPRGFTGCNYWYLDKYSMAQEGGYVWVKMGRRETEQIVYVDSVRYYMDDDAPYNPDLIKHVLRKTTKEELEEK